MSLSILTFYLFSSNFFYFQFQIDDEHLVYIGWLYLIKQIQMVI